VADTLRRSLALCLVTDPILVPRGELVATVLAAVRGGVTMVQLRDKGAPDDEVATQAEMLLRVLRPLGIPLIVNDRVDVARRVGADGVHLGRSDEAPMRARATLGTRAIIGLSISNEIELASADAASVDYYGLGPCFATATKPDHDPPLGLVGTRRLVARANRPCVAIGGIDVTRAASILATGIDGLAVVSAICGQPDPERAARELVSASNHARVEAL